MKKTKNFPQDYDFNEVVDTLAGEALLRLVRGEYWRTIVWHICNTMSLWSNRTAKRK